jgi:hypothetical protein
MDSSSGGENFGMFIGLLFAAAIYFLPTFIAFKRQHGYKNIILVMNVFGFSGVLWIIAMIWAVFPTEKSLIDPVVGNVTGTGERNAGDTIGSAKFGFERGYQSAGGLPKKSTALETLGTLADLKSKGAITEEEFQAAKQRLLDESPL